MASETLFNCLVEEQTDDEAYFQDYWARGGHMGEAVEKIMAAARDNGLTHPEPKEINPYDIENLEGEVFPSTESDVFWSTTIFSFTPESTFSFPVGIIDHPKVLSVGGLYPTYATADSYHGIRTNERTS